MRRSISGEGPMNKISPGQYFARMVTGRLKGSDGPPDEFLSFCGVLLIRNSKKCVFAWGCKAARGRTLVYHER